MAPVALRCLLLSAILSCLRNSKTEGLVCPAINEPGVGNYTLRFPRTPVPAVDWTVICYKFSVPFRDSEVDIIAIEPIIDNTEVLHAMLLLGCVSEPISGNNPYSCNMGADSNCNSYVGLWSLGSAGQCLDGAFGFRLGGPGGSKYAVLQLFWNNTQLKRNIFDSSGMKVYYTTRLRPYGGGISQTGQTYLEIPPGQNSVTVTGSCRPACTTQLPRSIYISSAALHMHFLGKSGSIQLIRNGMVVSTLIDVPVHQTVLDIGTKLDHPIELKPGDEVKVTCVYQSIQRNSTTYFGYTTKDEMCMGLVTYYPLTQGASSCYQWKSVDWCSDVIYNNKSIISESCRFDQFLSIYSPLNSVCADNCTKSDCVTLVNQLYATGCMSDVDMKSFLDAFLNPYYQTLIRCSPSHKSYSCRPYITNVWYVLPIIACFVGILVGKEIG